MNMATYLRATAAIGAGLDIDKMPAHWLMARLGKRVLRPGGRQMTRWLLEHAAIGPADDVVEFAPGLQADLSAAVHVGVRIGTVRDWIGWMEDAGFFVQDVAQMPMRLLELDRLIGDEGVIGTTRFIAHAMQTPGAVHRLLDVRRVFPVLTYEASRPLRSSPRSSM